MDYSKTVLFRSGDVVYDAWVQVGDYTRHHEGWDWCLVDSDNEPPRLDYTRHHEGRDWCSRIYTRLLERMSAGCREEIAKKES